MKTSLAWHNVWHDKRRTMVAVLGVAFALLLIFMQLGFYTACRTSATLVYDSLEFDAILVSKPYVHLRSCGTIPRIRLMQAAAVPGVKSVEPLFVTTALWRNVAKHVDREILVLGVRPDLRPFRTEDINEQLRELSQADTVLMDRVSRPLIGPHQIGTATELNGRRVVVIGEFERGAGLIADGSLVVSDLTFARLTGDRSLNHVQLGLVRVADDVDRNAVLEQLRNQLPHDVRVWSREQLKQHEQHFFLHVKPVGFMFTSGVFVGLIVGAVILYQILAADIAQQIPQYATLKAMGYGASYLYRVVMVQGILFALLGYVPALIASVGVYALVRNLADMPMFLSVGRAALVLTLSAAMCTISGVFAVRKVNAADPADLF